MCEPALIGVNSSEAHIHMRLVSNQKLGCKMEEKTDFLWCSYLATWGQSENGRQMVPHFMNEVGVGKKKPEQSGERMG